MIRAKSEPDEVEQFPSTRATLGARDPCLRLRQLDVLEGGQHRQKKESLKDEADLAEPQAAAIGIRQSAHIPALELDLSCRRHVHASQDVEKGGLPTARRTDD